MKKHYLMLKQHKVTGLKYLCYHFGTRENCSRYRGSGLHWGRHLQKHGYKISTTILAESETKEVLSKQGLYYSDLWDVVNSKDFANLIREDCKTTSAPLQRPNVRKNRDKALKDRIAKDGLTEKEKAAKLRGCIAMQQPLFRQKAKMTINHRLATTGQTEKEKQRSVKRAKRMKEGRLTDKELSAYQKIREYQIGKTMQERLNDPDYRDPRTGKTMQEIKKDPNWISPNKGKTMKERMGPEWINKQCKPFVLRSSLGERQYQNEREFIVKTHFCGPNLTRLKREGTYTVKRQRNTKHPFKHGETISLKYL